MTKAEVTEIIQRDCPLDNVANAPGIFRAHSIVMKKDEIYMYRTSSNEEEIRL